MTQLQMLQRVWKNDFDVRQIISIEHKQATSKGCRLTVRMRNGVLVTDIVPNNQLLVGPV